MKHVQLAILFFGLCLPAAAVEPTAKLISVKKLWDQAPHCAFTDLAYWKGQFVCAFREGRSHVSTDGGIQVLTSPDGETWTPAPVITLAGFDLRDAGLSVTHDNRLMLTGGAAPRKNDHEGAPTGTFVSFSDDAKSWSTPKVVVEPGHWLWRVNWHDGKAYGVSYVSSRTTNNDLSTALLTSDDGLAYTALQPKMFDDGWATEATLRFAKDGTMYCLQRRDGKPLPSAFFGISRPPYTDWKWHDLGTFIGGPNFMQLPSGQWIAAGRFYTSGKPKTAVARLDVEKATIEPILELPSGGDSSYPGLVWHDDTLWVSYYSSHEGKTNIYLAEVRIE